MGAIARTIHEGGGKVIGVIPDALKKIERPGKPVEQGVACLLFVGTIVHSLISCARRMLRPDLILTGSFFPRFGVT